MDSGWYFISTTLDVFLSIVVASGSEDGKEQTDFVRIILICHIAISETDCLDLWYRFFGPSAASLGVVFVPLHGPYCGVSP